MNRNLSKIVLGLLAYALVVETIAYILPAGIFAGSLSATAIPAFLIILWLYILEVFDFNYVKRHIERFESTGPVRVKQEGLFTVLRFSAGNPISSLDLNSLPHHLRYGRWTVYQYRFGNLSFEFWHDSPLFTDNWYFIQY